ncbi:MAG: LolA family protein, partial [Methanococcaceae archaeon]
SINNSTAAKARLLFQKEEKYRIEFKNLEIISDGKTLWNYNKRSNKVIINDVKKGSGTFSLKAMIIDFPAESKVESLGKETAGPVRCDVLRLTALKQGSIKMLKIWADESGLPRKIEMTDPSNNVMTFELSNIKVDQPISGSRFKFEAPKGSEVIDLR